VDPCGPRSERGALPESYLRGRRSPLRLLFEKEEILGIAQYTGHFTPKYVD
jgi:hypothetical protein